MTTDTNRYHKQRVMLETDEGNAPDFDALIAIWHERLKQCGATHYRIRNVAILKHKGKVRT